MTVLIVGAGPTGLTVGCELLRRGVPCRLVDAALGTFPGSRGKGLSSRTLEVFDDLGVLPAIRSGGMAFPPFRFYDATGGFRERTVFDLIGLDRPEPTAAAPHVGPWLVPQWRTDEILLARFTALGGTIDVGTALTAVTQDGDGVTAVLEHAGGTERFRADYLVGSDGGRSTVRKTLGVGFAGETFPTERIIIGDVRADGLDGVACHVFAHAADASDRFSLWNLPDADGYFQMVTHATEGDVPPLTLPAMQALLEHRSGRTDLRLRDLRWISLYRINVRMVDRFRIGRVFLAGDAAHVHSSAGGQGLNAGVQDGYNLGWKLAAVLAGAPDALLDTYQDERMPVAADLLDMTSTLHRRSFTGDGRRGPAIDQLDVTYRGGPLAVDDRADPGALRAGDRAPDGPLAGGGTLFDAFRGPHWTLVAFGDGPDLVSGLPVVRAARSAGYDVADGTLVLVRPDGHIGVLTTSADTVRAYLSRWGQAVHAPAAAVSRT